MWTAFKSAWWCRVMSRFVACCSLSVKGLFVNRDRDSSGQKQAAQLGVGSSRASLELSEGSLLALPCPCSQAGASEAGLVGSCSIQVEDTAGATCTARAVSPGLPDPRDSLMSSFLVFLLLPRKHPSRIHKVRPSFVKSLPPFSFP